MIPWWKIKFGDAEIENVSSSIRAGNLSLGPVTKKFENHIAQYLDVPYVIATSSGSSALMMSLIAVGVGVGDEVIIPNRTWIATAHAPFLLGAKVVLVDVENDRPIIDVSKIEEKITERTKVIIPVHMNGRGADMDKINKIAAKYDLYVVEDACQALGSTKYGCKLGTQSDVGVFSLSVTKIISSGQGGFAVTHDKAIAELLRDIRTHGVETVVNPTQWSHPGFNFRITDVQASIALEQLNKISSHIDNVTKIYLMYLDGVANNDLVKAIEVDLEGGEVPVYNEFLVKSLDVFSNYLSDRGIESRGFYPSVNSAGYLQQTGDVFPNSHMYEKEGIYLPSGPSQDFCDIKYVVDTLNDYG